MVLWSSESNGVPLAASGSVSSARLEVKIRDLERNEPPHATILWRQRAWRFGLRGRTFLDDAPDPTDVPAEIVTEVLRQLDVLCHEWDAMYPENPIESREDDDD